MQTSLGQENHNSLTPSNTLTAETETVPIQNAQVLEGLLSTCHSDNDRPLWADDLPTLDYSAHQCEELYSLAALQLLKVPFEPYPFCVLSTCTDTAPP